MSIFHSPSSLERALSIGCVLCALATGALAPIDTVMAQTRIAIRGYEFDPLEVERRGIEGAQALGIDERLRAPQRQNDEPHWRMLQFARLIRRDERNTLQQRYGLKLDVYLDGVYIERIDLDTVARIRADRDLQGVLRASIPYHPAFKLMPSIGEREFQTERRRAIEGLLLRAIPFDGTNLAALADQIRAAGATDVVVKDDRAQGGRGQIVFLLQGTEELAGVAQIDGIRSVEEVGESRLDNGHAARLNQSGIDNAAGATIWSRDIFGDEQLIGIIDDGPADLKHCFFEDPEQDTAGASHRKVVELRNKAASSSTDHATFVAGAAAGDDHMQPGMHPQRGGAWAAQLVLGNICDFDDSCPNAPPSTFLQELVRARQTGAHVHSNSWHDPMGYSSLAADVDRFTWDHEEDLVLGAAGDAIGVWGPPAVSRNAIAVAAAQSDPMQWGQGYVSAPPTGQRKPDLAAVGCGISSAAIGTGGSTCGVTPPRACSTSVATPHAAAIATLARQYFVEGRYPSGIVDADESLEPSAALLKATMINSARDMLGVPGIFAQREGWGVVTLDRTLAFQGSGRQMFVKDLRNTNPNALQNGDTPHEYVVSVTSAEQPLKVTLVWTDYPSESGSITLVNDLDLEVVAPNEPAPYRGNVFDDVTAGSIKGGVADGRNNVEQVLINSPPTGDWRIRVSPSPTGGINQLGVRPGQGYALVVTAAMRPPAVLPNPPVNFELR